MAAATTLSNVQNLSPGTSPLTSPPNTSLFDRIDWVFGFYVGFLIAGASYCLYHLYQAYQLKHHTAFGLDDRFKLIKCQALLTEAKEKEKKGENAQPLLQECESLLALVKGNLPSDNKEQVVLQLALYLAKNDPTRSYQMAQQLTSSHDLFKAAETIKKNHPRFDPTLLNDLFTQAFVAMNQEEQTSRFKNSYLGFVRLLDFAKAFHAVNNHASVSICIRKALDFANASETPSNRIDSLCQIVKCYHAIEDYSNRNSSLESAERLFLEKKAELSIVDQIHTRLGLARTFFFVEMFEKMDQELEVITQLIQALDPLISIKLLYSLAALVAQMKTAPSSFKSASMDVLITRAVEALRTPQSGELKASSELIDNCLNLASVYEFLGRTAEGQPTLELAFREIKSLPEASKEESESKVDAILKLLDYYQDPTVAKEPLAILKGFYDRASADIGSHWKKDTLGRRILVLYKKMGLTTEADVFFQKYLADLKKMEKDPFKKISRLVNSEIHFNRVHLLGLLPDQRKKILEAAEALLPQLNSIDYKLSLATIMKGYALVDQQKSFQLLEIYENQEARSHFITAMALPVIMGVLYHSPPTGLWLSLGYAVFSSWKG